MRTLLRQGDTMIAVESDSALVDYDDILAATKVEPDNCFGETPWENCDDFKHTCTTNFDYNALHMRGYCYCDFLHTHAVIQLSKDEDWGLYEWHRKHGATRQVAQEAVAAEHRRTLDQLVDWYSNGWQWFGVQCDFEVLGENFYDSIWGIDDEDYAKQEVVPEIADAVADQLEKAGFTVNNRPIREPYPNRASKKTRLQHNLNFQNWSD